MKRDERRLKGSEGKVRHGEEGRGGKGMGGKGEWEGRRDEGKGRGVEGRGGEERHHKLPLHTKLQHCTCTSVYYFSIVLQFITKMLAILCFHCLQNDDVLKVDKF